MDELIQHDVNVDKFLSGSDLGEVLKVDIKVIVDLEQIVREKTQAERRSGGGALPAVHERPGEEAERCEE